MPRLYLATIICLALLGTQGCHQHDDRSTASSPRDVDPFIYLPAVETSGSNHDTATCILLSTDNVARFDNKKQEKPYVNSVQIVDADEPWPPRWYTATPFYSDSAFERDTKDGYYRYDFTLDGKIDGRFFTFYKILSRQPFHAGQLSAPEFAAYILLNEKMQPADTVRSNTRRSNMFFHDLRLNDRGERMVNLKRDTYLDLRDYTGDDKDTSVHCNYDHIQIQDSTGRIVFNWNPLHHLDPDLFNYKQAVRKKAFAANNSDLLEWTRLTSALWDYDGDILYAMKQIGIGKISRADGHVIWQINGRDMPLVADGDTLEWYSPHDLNYLSDNSTSATYSLYSNGKEGSKYAKGVIFSMDKKTHKARLVKYVAPQLSYYANGQGNLEYFANGDYAIGYGFFDQPDSLDNRDVMEYRLHDGTNAVYQLPKHIYTYKARLLRSWPKPARPQIIRQGDHLTVSGDASHLVWYKLTGPKYHTVQKVGTCATITPEKGAIYCVEQPYGIGYTVSRMYRN